MNSQHVSYRSSFSIDHDDAKTEIISAQREQDATLIGGSTFGRSVTLTGPDAQCNIGEYYDIGRANFRFYFSLFGGTNHAVPRPESPLRISDYGHGETRTGAAPPYSPDQYYPLFGDIPVMIDLISKIVNALRDPTDLSIFSDLTNELGSLQSALASLQSAVEGYQGTPLIRSLQHTITPRLRQCHRLLYPLYCAIVRYRQSLNSTPIYFLWFRVFLLTREYRGFARDIRRQLPEHRVALEVFSRAFDL